MQLPPEAAKWIKLHRTHLKGDVIQGYIDDVANDFEQIKPYLPPKLDTVIDIGCGMAGIDILIAKAYPSAHIILLDGDGPESNFRGGFEPTMQPFTDRSIVNEAFKLNGLNLPEWRDVGTQDVQDADLIISLLSWGFHYPLSTYTTVGLHITDIRRGERVQGIVIASNPKFSRCVWR